MRVDIEEVKRIEQERGLLSLFTVRQESQYLYKKMLSEIPDKVLVLQVKNVKNTCSMKFVSAEDYAEFKKKHCAVASVKEKRGYRGRPFNFCAGCEHVNSCSFDIPCENRDVAMQKRAQKAGVAGDDRYWKNGVPKKHLILCKYAKYMYAHKKTAGQCQKEKCRFFEDGKCALELYK